ncbi:MAG: hypothetical protein HOK24_20840 [Desulfobacula sp.]|jgi:hypothetical protein|nr:hypothetical protein [Desulfobacula sp.]MBT5546903.1 hypothetical protein [Desulfobacula sp.]MBT7262165.1 hypothetical protein [Desulfobacula sp.]
MKFINSESIKENEKKFIDTINAALDWEAVGKMLMEKYNFTLQDKIECENGDLVVCNDMIAYKFDFEIKVPLSVMVNRQGECLEISTAGKEDEELIQDDLFQDADPDMNPAPPTNPEQEKKVSQMASNIADMISEINQGD